jgi:hypothetical protein
MLHIIIVVITIGSTRMRHSNVRGGKTSSSERGRERSHVRKVPGKPREGCLIKVGAIRENELLGCWIVELPPFVLSRVSHKDSFLKMRT